MRTAIRGCGFACIVMLSSGCGDSGTSPDSKLPLLRVVSGEGITDTILTRLPQPLVVELRDSTGVPARGLTVRFEAVPPEDPWRSVESAILVSAPAGNQYTKFATNVTDSLGRARVLIQFGSVSGTARVRISAPELNAVDTATFTVKPGSPQQFVIVTRDTVVQPTAVYSLNAFVADHYANRITSEGIGYTPGAGITAVSPTGQVTAGPAIARAQIVLRWGLLVDTARVSVLPRLRLVGTKDHSPGRAVSLVNLDGTNSVEFTVGNDASFSPDANKAGDRIVFYQGDPDVAASLWIIDVPGAARRLLPSNSGLISAFWPRWSPDAQWIYFGAIKTSLPNRSLWRIRPDGTGLDSVATLNPPISFAPPAVSPDGKTVIIEDVAGLKVIDVATKTFQIVRTFCGVPRYSPDGSRLACLKDGTLSVMNLDGTDIRVLGKATFSTAYDVVAGIDWTPDGQWILARLFSQGFHLVNIADGTVLNLKALAESYRQLAFVR